jgi:hypothetical protein
MPRFASFGEVTLVVVFNRRGLVAEEVGLILGPMISRLPNRTLVLFGHRWRRLVSATGFRRSR